MWRPPLHYNIRSIWEWPPAAQMPIGSESSRELKDRRSIQLRAFGQPRAVHPLLLNQENISHYNCISQGYQLQYMYRKAKGHFQTHWLEYQCNAAVRLRTLLLASLLWKKVCSAGRDFALKKKVCSAGLSEILQQPDGCAAPNCCCFSCILTTESLTHCLLGTFMIPPARSKLILTVWLRLKNMRSQAQSEFNERVFARGQCWF